MLPSCSFLVNRASEVVSGYPMSEDFSIPWLLQHSTIWIALLAGLAPGLIASSKRRSMTLWYFYGFACTLVASPLIALPTIHAFLIRPRVISREDRQRRRRADALGLLAESSVLSYPTWIAELRRRSPEGIDRRRYVYKAIGPGESIELIRQPAHQRHKHAVAFRHGGVHLGYVPRRHHWVAPALDDGRRLVAIVDKVKVGGIFRRRAKFVRVRIAVLDVGP